MRRDDILLNELYSKVCNREVVNEDLKGIFNTAKEKMSSFFNNDKPENTELKKILNQINELKLILITNGYEPREFLNFDKIKTLSGGSASGTSQPETSASSQVSNVEPQTSTQPEAPSFTSQPETKDDSRFAPRPSTPKSSEKYSFDRFKGLANVEGLKKLESQLGSEEIPTEGEPPFKKEKVSILDFKSEMGLSEDEFSYLKRNGLFGNDIKNGMIPKKYMDDENIWYYLDQRRTAPKKSNVTSKPAVARKPAVTKKPSKISAAIQKATPKSKKP
jgi:hypothetical protein